MLQQRSIQSSLSFRDKILSIDYLLVFSILVLGIVSMFAMYSTDGGEFKYHTNSHILRFFVFFGMFFVVSFIFNQVKSIEDSFIQNFVNQSNVIFKSIYGVVGHIGRNGDKVIINKNLIWWCLEIFKCVSKNFRRTT